MKMCGMTRIDEHLSDAKRILGWRHWVRSLEGYVSPVSSDKLTRMRVFNTHLVEPPGTIKLECAAVAGTFKTMMERLEKLFANRSNRSCHEV